MSAGPSILMTKYVHSWVKNFLQSYKDFNWLSELDRMMTYFTARTLVVKLHWARRSWKIGTKRVLSPVRNVQLASVGSAYLQVTKVIPVQNQMKQLSDSGLHAMESKIAQCVKHVPKKTKAAIICIVSAVNLTGAGSATRRQTSFIMRWHLGICSRDVLAFSSPWAMAGCSHWQSLLPFSFVASFMPQLPSYSPSFMPSMLLGTAPGFVQFKPVESRTWDAVAPFGFV